MARILVCEDSHSQALNLKMILETAGHDVVLAENGQIGLDHLQAGSVFDIVLSDVQMPELGGFDLCRMIRQQPQFTGLPVILLTALSDMQDMRQGHDVGANMYVVKPFVASDLLRRLAKFLSPRGAADAPAAPAASSQAAAPMQSATSARPPTPSAEPAVQISPPVQAPPPPVAAPASTAESTAPAASPPPQQIAVLQGLLSKIQSTCETALTTFNYPGLSELLQDIRLTTSKALEVCSGSPPAGDAASSARPSMLLLVEPSDSLRGTLKLSLGKLGYTVHAVTSSDEGVAACQTHGSAIGIMVTEAINCSAELISAVKKANSSARMLCLVGGTEVSTPLPPDVPTLTRPFTMSALLARLRELQETG